MKLPQNIVEGAFQIGEKKYALFASFVLCSVEENDQPAAILYRPGEVSCINTTPDGENPFEMETAPLVPRQLDAATVEEAAAQLGIELLGVAKRITDYEAKVAAADVAAACDKPLCCGDASCQAETPEAQPDEKA